MVELIITLIVGLLLIYLVWFLVGKMALPEPIPIIVLVVLVLIMLVYLARSSGLLAI